MVGVQTGLRRVGGLTSPTPAASLPLPLFSRHRADRRVEGWLRRNGWVGGFAKVDNVFLLLGGFAKVDNRFGLILSLQGGSKGWIHLYKRYV